MVIWGELSPLWLALKMALSQEMWASYEVRKGMEMYSSLETPEGMSPVNALILAYRTYFGHLTSRNRRQMNLCCHMICGNLLSSNRKLILYHWLKGSGDT